MADPHLDHPGEITWFPGKGPAQVLGPCPHRDCPHDSVASIAWGPDFERYSLDECRVPAEQGGCAGTCRSWASETPKPRGGVAYGWKPYLHVQIEAPAELAPPVEAVPISEELLEAVDARAGTLAEQLEQPRTWQPGDPDRLLPVDLEASETLEDVYRLGRIRGISALLEELEARGWLIFAPDQATPGD